MRFRGKKGTEKPIEIFIALFIILAVSMVMLKMFKGQIGEQTQKMQEERLKQERQERIDAAKMKCNELCTAAKQASCSKKKVATYCTHRLGGEDDNMLDWDGDGETHVDTKSLGGPYMCEDAIYCPLVSDCTCGKELDLNNCIEQSCKYWSEIGMDQETMLNEQFPFTDGNLSESLSPRCTNSDDFNADLMIYSGTPKNCSEAVAS